MARLSSIFETIDTKRNNEINILAEKISKVLVLNESESGLDYYEVEKEVFKKASSFETLDEAKAFLLELEIATFKTDLLTEAGFLKKAFDATKMFFKNLGDKLAGFFGNKHLAQIRIWNRYIKKLIKEYQGLDESLIIEAEEANKDEIDFKAIINNIAESLGKMKATEILTEDAIKKLGGSESDKQEEDPKKDDKTEPETEDGNTKKEDPEDNTIVGKNKKYMQKLLGTSKIFKNSDGFYTSMNVDPKKFKQSLYKFMMNYNYDLFNMLVVLNGKSRNKIRPLDDMEFYTLMANMSLLADTIFKLSKMGIVPATETPADFKQNFARKFKILTDKHLAQELNRANVEAEINTLAGEQSATATNTQNAEEQPTTNVEPEVDEAPAEGETEEMDILTPKNDPSLEAFKKNNNTLYKSFTSSPEAASEFYKYIQKYKISSAEASKFKAITDNNDFLENGINVEEKVKLVHTLLNKRGIRAEDVNKLIEFIMSEGLEEDFHKNEVFQNLDELEKMIKNDLKSNTDALAEKIFNKRQL